MKMKPPKGWASTIKRMLSSNFEEIKAVLATADAAKTVEDVLIEEHECEDADGFIRRFHASVSIAPARVEIEEFLSDVEIDNSRSVYMLIVDGVDNVSRLADCLKVDCTDPDEILPNLVQTMIDYVDEWSINDAYVFEELYESLNITFTVKKD